LYETTKTLTQQVNVGIWLLWAQTSLPESSTLRFLRRLIMKTTLISLLTVLAMAFGATSFASGRKGNTKGSVFEAALLTQFQVYNGLEGSGKKGRKELRSCAVSMMQSADGTLISISNAISAVVYGRLKVYSDESYLRLDNNEHDRVTQLYADGGQTLLLELRKIEDESTYAIAILDENSGEMVSCVKFEE